VMVCPSPTDIPGECRVKPNPFIMGGYQSPDILMFDALGRVVPLANSPSGTTLLHPNTEYAIAAVIHNDTAADAVDTVIRFWAFPCGRVCEGSLIDVQTVTVPRCSSVRVDSSLPFRSACHGLHACVAVSIFHAESIDAAFDPAFASDVPWTRSGVHGSTAWRNTDSMSDY